MLSSNIVQPRLLRPAPDPNALYFRVGSDDYKDFLHLLASGTANCFGAVFDPTLVKSHEELRHQILNHRLDAILDPRTHQSATPGGHSKALGKLPWGIVGRPHCPDDFQGTQGNQRLRALAEFTLKHGYTQLLAPTHIISSANDEWFEIDLQSTRELRNILDRVRGARIPLIYPLTLSYLAFRDADQRERIVQRLQDVPAAQLWLRIERFGSGSTAAATRNFLEGVEDFAELDIPIIADYVGGLTGLALVSFGAVGGLAHGVTLFERFESSHWKKEVTGSGFRAHTRVYLPKLDLHLKNKEAKALFETTARAKAAFGCRDTNCCPRGITDMLKSPGAHFMYQRMEQLSELSRVPERIRPQHFLDQILRPVADDVLSAANSNWIDEGFKKRLSEQRKHLDSLLKVLGQHVRENRPHRHLILPETRVVRDARL